MLWQNNGIHTCRIRRTQTCSQVSGIGNPIAIHQRSLPEVGPRSFQRLLIHQLARGIR